MTDASVSDQELDKQEGEIVRSLCDFIDQVVTPLQEKLAPIFSDQRRYFGDDGLEVAEVVDARRTVRTASAEAGIYNLFAPSSIGGGGKGFRPFFLCTEAIGERYGPGEPCAPLAQDALANVFSGPGPIWTQASPSLQEEVLPGLMSGELQGCFAMTESDAGSDVWMMQTRARREGDVWVIDGAKHWISWAGHADFVLLFAVTDPGAYEARKGGLSCFYVPTSTPGYTFAESDRIFGQIGGREGILLFNGVTVPDSYRIGEAGEGLKMAFLTLAWTRFWLSARHIGEAKWALRKAFDFTRTRTTFGQRLCDHETIQDILADCCVELFGARAMALECANRAERGMNVRTETAMLKLFAVNAASRVIDRAIQMQGHRGVRNVTRMFDAWATARTSRITEGGDEIMRRNIALDLLRTGTPSW